MPVEVKVTAVLQRMVGGARSVNAEGRTVGELIDYLERHHPGFKRQVTTEDGQLHRFVNIYLNDEDVRFLKQLATPVNEKDVISILPALAGGRS